MKKKAKKKILPMIIVALAVAALGTTPALAKSQKKSSSQSRSSAATAASAIGLATGNAPAPKAGQHDTKPGPAWRMIGGTVKNIQGDIYTVEDYEGNQVRLYVGQGTKQLRGNKKVGDTVRAEITRGGFANSIQ